MSFREFKNGLFASVIHGNCVLPYHDVLKRRDVPYGAVQSFSTKQNAYHPILYTDLCVTCRDSPAPKGSDPNRQVVLMFAVSYSEASFSGDGGPWDVQRSSVVDIDLGAKVVSS